MNQLLNSIKKVEQRLSNVYLEHLSQRETRSPGLRFIAQMQNERIVKRNKLNRTRALDVGCGTGTFLLYLMNYSKMELAVGVDISKVGLNLTKSRVKSAHLVLADADHLPFRNSSFEFLIYRGILHHLSNPLITLKESYRVLCKSGFAIVREFNMTNYFARFVRCLCHAFGYKIERTNARNYFPNEIFLFLRNAGYQSIIFQFDTIYVWYALNLLRLLREQGILNKLVSRMELNLSKKKRNWSQIAQGVVFIATKYYQQ